MEVTQFHNLSHIFISLIGAILLLAIYYNIKNRFQGILEEDDSKKRLDRGLLYLSLGVFVWVFSGFWAYISIHYQFHETFMYQVGVNLFSIVNNMFFLLAIYYFYNAPSFIYKNEKNVKLIMTIIVVVTLSTLVISYFFENKFYHNIKINALPDLVLSSFLSYLLLISLYRTFMERKLKLVANISAVIIVLILLSQLPNVILNFGNDFINNLIKIIAKSSLISIFLVLATSWVIELANTPKIKEMQIQFIDWSLIKLTIPSKGINEEIIDFGSKTTQYKNLLKFGVRRKYGDGDFQCIKVGAGGEITNQTYLSRILDNIYEIQNDKDLDKLERKDIFTFLGEGKYRLRILPEHIEIEKNLLSEFSLQNKDHQFYKTL